MIVREPSANSSRAEARQRARPAVDVTAGLLRRHAVALDDAAHERVALAAGTLNVVIGEPAPVFACLTLEQ